MVKADLIFSFECIKFTVGVGFGSAQVHETMKLKQSGIKNSKCVFLCTQTRKSDRLRPFRYIPIKKLEEIRRKLEKFPVKLK